MNQGSPAILVIDMINDFVLPGSTLEVAGAGATIPAISEFLDFGRQNGWQVIYCNRIHRLSGIDVEKTREHYFRNNNPFCLPDSFGAQIVKGLEPHHSDIIIEKLRFSAFMGTGLDFILRRLKSERIFITGTQYPNCIRSTAVDALCLDYEPVVCIDCCSAATREVADANIFDMRNMGITCIKSDKIMQGEH